MSWWTSSGSSRSDSEVKPETSTKSTVTCLRSPSSAALELRIFSARCLGVYESGAGARDCPGWLLPSTGSPHSLQNFAPAGSSVAHDWQMTASFRPHSRQNLASPGLSCRHWGQRITLPGSPGVRDPLSHGSPIIGQRTDHGKCAHLDTDRADRRGAIVRIEEE